MQQLLKNNSGAVCAGFVLSLRWDVVGLCDVSGRMAKKHEMWAEVKLTGEERQWYLQR